MCGLIVECSDVVAEAGAPVRSSLTFGRNARLAEVVREATEFVFEEADAEEFFIELEGVTRGVARARRRDRGRGATTSGIASRGSH